MCIPSSSGQTRFISIQPCEPSNLQQCFVQSALVQYVKKWTATCLGLCYVLLCGHVEMKLGFKNYVEISLNIFWDVFSIVYCLTTFCGKQQRLNCASNNSLSPEATATRIWRCEKEKNQLFVTIYFSISNYICAGYSYEHILFILVKQERIRRYRLEYYCYVLFWCDCTKLDRCKHQPLLHLLPDHPVQLPSAGTSSLVFELWSMYQQ